MKLKYLVLSIALALTTNAFANTIENPIEKKVPLDHYKVFGNTLLKINYDMNGDELQKVVCVFSNFYKGYFDYMKDGVKIESPTFGDVQQVVFTSKGKTQDVNAQHLDSLNQISVDPVGAILLHDVVGDEGRVTCSYQTETNK